MKAIAVVLLAAVTAMPTGDQAAAPGPCTDRSSDRTEQVGARRRTASLREIEPGNQSLVPQRCERIEDRAVCGRATSSTVTMGGSLEIARHVMLYR